MRFADHVITGAHIRTLDPKRPCASQLAIWDGIIVAVDDVRHWRGARTEVHDLRGATLVPGLVDGHQHPIPGATRFTGLDLSGCRTPAQLRDAVAAEARRLPNGQWLTGHGLSRAAFGGSQVTAELLDDVLGERPAYLVLFDAHSALASKAALRAAGITGPREFASRARIVCAADGTPTGHLLEHPAMDLVQRVVPAAPLCERRAQVVQLLKEMAATGLTGAHAMDMEADTLEIVKGIDRLPIRLRFAPWASPGIGEDDLDRLIALRHHRGERWSVGAVKFFLDGTVEGGTAWLAEPDRHGENTASFWRDPEAYSRTVRHVVARGFGTATYAIGDAAVRHALDTLAALPRTAGHRIEHIETLPLADVRRFAELGVAASMQPTHPAFTSADHTDPWSARLGGERALRAWPMRDLHESGATVVLGSDWPVAPYDPRILLASARLRRLPGTRDDPVVPAQAICGEAALAGLTRNAAVASCESHVAGRIATGYRADLTALAVDPVTAPPDELAEAPVVLTMVDGEVTFA